MVDLGRMQLRCRQQLMTSLQMNIPMPETKIGKIPSLQKTEEIASFQHVQPLGPSDSQGEHETNCNLVSSNFN